MNKSYTTVHHTAEFVFEDRKSTFIGICSPVSSEEEALEFVQNQKKRFPDARHHVYAYVLKDNSIARFTDDREPSGTAGMPVLDTIRKNGCVNTVIVVIRYFGGILLGTGGLVHAYGAAALGALRAAEIITYDTYAELDIFCSYSDYQKLLPIFNDHDFAVRNTEYYEDVKIIGTVLAENTDIFKKKLTEATSGRISIKKIGEAYDFRK